VESLVPLCDPGRAADWVERAARAGRPFRVALPTYGYLLAFSPEGRFLGLSAEQAPPAWPPGTVVRALRADPVAMAGLVRRWVDDRPAALRGISWYRLPVEGDHLNWAPVALREVAAGRAPRAEVTVHLRRPDPALVDLELANEGTAGAPLARTLELSWTGGALVAADALHGFLLERTPNGGVRVVPSPEAGLARLAPGERRPVAWLRFDRATQVVVRAAP